MSDGPVDWHYIPVFILLFAFYVLPWFGGKK